MSPDPIRAFGGGSKRRQPPVNPGSAVHNLVAEPNGAVSCSVSQCSEYRKRDTPLSPSVPRFDDRHGDIRRPVVGPPEEGLGRSSDALWLQTSRV